MPRVNAVVTCTATDDSTDTGNLNRLAAAIERAVTSVIGGQCRVIINSSRRAPMLSSAITAMYNGQVPARSAHSVTQYPGVTDNTALMRIS